MSDRDLYGTIESTKTLLETLRSRECSAAGRRQFLDALGRLDTDERHPSFRVHSLEGRRAGLWSASDSRRLRMTFERAEGGRKRLLACSRHYGD